MWQDIKELSMAIDVAKHRGRMAKHRGRMVKHRGTETQRAGQLVGLKLGAQPQPPLFNSVPLCLCV